MAVEEFPYVVCVKYLDPLTETTSYERARWAREHFNEFRVEVLDSRSHTEYHFKNEADATLFALKWGGAQ